jgi:hypothetical protein
MTRRLFLRSTLFVLAMLLTAGARPEAAGKKQVPESVRARMPADATALCGDNSWSAAAKKSGACSSHGGVAIWYGPAPKGATGRCKDGTWTKASESQGACSSHGGVAFWLKAVPKPAGHP